MLPDVQMRVSALQDGRILILKKNCRDISVQDPCEMVAIATYLQQNYAQVLHQLQEIGPGNVAMALPTFKVGFPPLNLGKHQGLQLGGRVDGGAREPVRTGARGIETCQRPHGFLGERRQVTAHHAVLAPPANTSLLVIGHLFFVDLAQCAPTVDVRHLGRPDTDCLKSALVRFSLRVVRDFSLAIVALKDMDLVPILGA